ncbi:MAG: hypothetical protein IJG85_03580 [Eubacteriaceae bacterium]|nr:hypothetical protein [Eubacteriaceae bacterium]
MTEFELYIMIFQALDHYWDKHQGEALGMFLSGMNPFLFQGEGSAVPDYYISYQRFIGGRTITVRNSFDLAMAYIKDLDKDYITEAFAWVERDAWMEKAMKMFQGHKS